ncbi:MAG: hypothetical protein GQ559_10155 [Desulfobulbaceae bacterium]|nr:hypothetical protein [Desulfobulbaceae bacterium]
MSGSFSTEFDLAKNFGRAWVEDLFPGGIFFEPVIFSANADGAKKVQRTDNTSNIEFYY